MNSRDFMEQDNQEKLEAGIDRTLYKMGLPMSYNFRIVNENNDKDEVEYTMQFKITVKKPNQTE